MKTLATMIIITLSLTACSIFQLVDPVSEPIYEIGQERTIIGTVFENVQEVPADGNNFLMVDTEIGRLTILYMEGGLLPVEDAVQQCHNNPVIAQSAQSIQAGNTVEIFGAVHEFYALEVCSNPDFYITLVEQATRQVTGEVVEVITDCAFDSICAYVVATESGEQVTVIWAEGMSPICQNDPFQGGETDILVADQIDSFGRVIDSTTTSACGDPSYYIRKTS